MPKNSKSWFEFKNSSNGVTEISIMDEIGYWGVTAKDFRDAFARLDANETVNLHICSPGGDVTGGNEIYNTIKAHKGPVNVTLGALCASIATVIAMAGSKITMAKNGLFMIHNVSVYTGGDSSDLRHIADVMDKMQANIVATYSERTSLTPDALAEMMDEETWMTAEEALANGFITAIAEEESSDDEAQNFDLSRFRNSAKLLSRLQGSEAAPESANAPGNGRRVVTLRDLETAVAFKNQSQKPILPKNKSMTPEEIAAQKAEIEKQAKAQALEIVKAQNARNKEIRDIVAAVSNRDKKDFTALGEEFINADKTVDEFARAMLTSDKFKNIEIIGSGIELIEPLDSTKGTAGFNFVNSEQFRAISAQMQRSGRHNFNMTLNVPAFVNTTQTSASPNQLTSIEYRPGISQLGLRQLRIKDLIMPGQTNSTTIRYRREDAFANAAAAVLETGALALVAVSVAEVDAPVKDIGGYIEMSENLMSDYLAVASFINMRLPYMVERTTEDELLNGDGTGAHITGLLATSGIQTQAKGGDTNFDAIHKAITLCRFVPNGTQANAQGGYEPDAIVMNPTDWQLLKLTKDGINAYYGGGPFSAPGAEYLWGKLVVVTPAIAAGTALVGAFRECAQYFQRQGVTIEMTNSNGTNFVNRIVTLRAAERLALTVPQPNGFAQVTGIA